MTRLADLVLCALLFVPACVFIVILSCLTIVINRFWPFFQTERVGKNGQLFTCYKLQCLQPAKSEEEIGNVIFDRLRMTKLGKLYRDHGWDEVPQIVNILKGEMSFVGPRPISESVYNMLEEKYPNKRQLIKGWKRERLKFLPGLSGWHQIHLTDHNIVKYDNEYITNRTWSKDLKIVVVSIIIFIIGKSSYFPTPIPVEMYEYQL